MSSAIHVWGIFSKNPSLEESSKTNLARNVKYLNHMKQYWGMFHYVAKNLKGIYRKHADASQGSEVQSEDANIFQYGDWFQKYPHGVSQMDYEDPATRVKKESTETDSSGPHQDLQSVEDFFHKLSPPVRAPPQKKATKKASRSAGQADQPPPLQPLQISTEQKFQQYPQYRSSAPVQPLSAPIVPNPMSPSSFAPHQTMYTPSHPTFPPSFDAFPMSPAPNGTAFHNQLDRHVLYGGYTGAEPASAPPLGALPPNQDSLNPTLQDAMPNSIWGASSGMEYQQQMMGVGSDHADLAATAWFMPFNLNRSDVGMDGNYPDFIGQGAMDGMGSMERQ